MTRGEITEDFIAWLKASYFFSDRFYFSSYVSTDDPMFWLCSAFKTNHKRFTTQEIPVPRVHGGSVDFNENLVVGGNWFWNLFEFELVGRTVIVVGDGFHAKYN